MRILEWSTKNTKFHTGVEVLERTTSIQKGVVYETKTIGVNNGIKDEFNHNQFPIKPKANCKRVLNHKLTTI